MDDVVNNVIDYICLGFWCLDWDWLMIFLDVLEYFEENCCVMCYIIVGQFLNIIFLREFVDFFYIVGYEEGFLFCGVSVEWSEMRLEFVCGYNYFCGWFCVLFKDSLSQSFFIGYIQIDLCGMIFQFVVDIVMVSMLVNFYSDL